MGPCSSVSARVPACKSALRFPANTHNLARLITPSRIHKCQRARDLSKLTSRIAFCPRRPSCAQRAREIYTAAMTHASCVCPERGSHRSNVAVANEFLQPPWVTDVSDASYTTTPAHSASVAQRFVRHAPGGALEFESATWHVPGAAMLPCLPVRLPRAVAVAGVEACCGQAIRSLGRPTGWNCRLVRVTGTASFRAFLFDPSEALASMRECIKSVNHHKSWIDPRRGTSPNHAHRPALALQAHTESSAAPPASSGVVAASTPSHHDKVDSDPPGSWPWTAPYGMRLSRRVN